MNTGKNGLEEQQRGEILSLEKVGEGCSPHTWYWTRWPYKKQTHKQATNAQSTAHTKTNQGPQGGLLKALEKNTRANLSL